MCPIWDLFFRTIERTTAALSWVKTSPVRPMEIDDAVLCLAKALGTKAQTFSAAELREIATGLRGDPILLAMFGATIPAEKSANAKAFSENVVEHFVVETVAELAAATNLPASDHHEALSRLSELMLNARLLYPSWHQVTEWMGNTSHLLDAIRSLAKQEKLCRIVDRSSDSTFEFRHDRILEFELSRAIARMLQDPSGNEDVLTEPFFVVVLGRAVAKTLLSSDQLQWTARHVPLALIASIAFFDGTNLSQEQQIVATASAWLSSSAKDPNTPSAVLSEACDLLEGTSSAYVLQITDGLPDDPAVAESRLANGDGEAGILFFSNGNEFYPSVRAPSVEAVLQRAIRSHNQQIVSSLSIKLTSGSLESRQLAGTLTLAGYIADPSLAEPVRVACQSCNSISEILVPALWAAFRCSSDNPANELRLLVEIWAATPETEDSHSISETMGISDILRRAMRHGISDQVIEHLTDIGRTVEKLRRAIAWLLQRVDHPSAVHYVAEVLAGLEHAAKEKGGFHHWSMFFRENWDTKGWPEGKRMSDESREELRHMWQSETEAEWLRTSAFETWVRATDDLQQLRAVSPDSVWFPTLLWRRILLGDIDATEYVLPKLATEDKWFRIIDHVWNRSFLVPTDDALAKLKQSTPTDYSGGKSNQHYFLFELLRDIPVSDAEPLVIKHWEYIKFSPTFIQLALYIGTPSLKERTAATIVNCPSASVLFQHVNSFFGYMTVGLEHRLSLRHLENLLPFIELLPDSALRDMLRFCSTNDLRDWSELHLKPECRRRTTVSPASQAESFLREHFPTDSDLIVELEKLESRPRPEWGIYYWLERFKERIGSIARGWTALISWYTKSPTEERFKILAHVVQWHGTRKELAALANLQVTHSSDATLLQLKNAEFSVKRRALS